MNELLKKLEKEAENAREKAYAPYSGFKVGAALLTKEGKIYQGCNIENVSFTPTCCAERVALFKAVSEGERNFRGIFILGGKTETDICFPCGVCRQALSEFCNDDFEIYLRDKMGNFKIYKLYELMPYSFKEMR
ncbi:MAG: cytidine deaminase [Clostridia bacterium]|nr:cytidine deaminase [Clostridia bacterium]